MRLDRTRFGPAGFPIDASRDEAFKYLNSVGLDGMEYQAVRRVPTNEKVLGSIREEAERYDILLTVHAPYAINLAAETEEKRKASIMRIIAAAEAARKMGALHVTFHPGYYLKRSPEEALKIAIESLREVIEEMKARGLDHIELGPETTGKPNQLGSLEEVMVMAEELDNVLPTIDFAHIHVREKGGQIRCKEDYRRIIEVLERRLGSADGLVIHFTEVEATSKGYGERRHHELGSGYGPDFEPLAEIMVELGVKWFVVSESPILERDSIKMREIYKRKLSEP